MTGSSSQPQFTPLLCGTPKGPAFSVPSHSVSATANPSQRRHGIIISSVSAIHHALSRLVTGLIGRAMARRCSDCLTRRLRHDGHHASAILSDTSRVRPARWATSARGYTHDVNGPAGNVKQRFMTRWHGVPGRHAARDGSRLLESRRNSGWAGIQCMTHNSGGTGSGGGRSLDSRTSDGMYSENLPALSTAGSPTFAKLRL